MFQGESQLLVQLFLHHNDQLRHLRRNNEMLLHVVQSQHNNNKNNNNVSDNNKKWLKKISLLQSLGHEIAENVRRVIFNK